MAFIGWLGTLLGATGMWLALTATPTTWSGHHRAQYVLLLVLIVVCVLITFGVPLVNGWRWVRFRLMVWRAGNAPPRLVVDLLVTPGSPTGSRAFAFNTNRARQRHIRTPGRPVGMRITAPVEASITAIPSTVRHYGKTIFRVDQFLPDGFVISEQAPGLTVEGEVSYAELPQKPSPAAPGQLAVPRRESAADQEPGMAAEAETR